MPLLDESLPGKRLAALEVVSQSLDSEMSNAYLIQTAIPEPPLADDCHRLNLFRRKYLYLCRAVEGTPQQASELSESWLLIHRLRIDVFSRILCRDVQIPKEHLSKTARCRTPVPQLIATYLRCCRRYQIAVLSLGHRRDILLRDS